MTMMQDKPAAFAPTTITTPQGPAVAMRRRGSTALGALPAGLAYAAQTYAATFEAVAAGGAATGHAAGGSVSKGASREGRQFHAMKLAEFLRKMDRAVGAEVIRVQKRGTGAVGALDLWQAITVRGYSFARFLEARGFKRGMEREAALRAALIATATRVADAIGADRSPWAD